MAKLKKDDERLNQSLRNSNNSGQPLDNDGQQAQAQPQMVLQGQPQMMPGMQAHPPNMADTMEGQTQGRPQAEPGQDQNRFMEGLPLEEALKMATGAQDVEAFRETIIGEKEVAKGAELLNQYKTARSAFEQRIADDELWWKLRHWDAIRNTNRKDDFVRPTSAWLFNAIINKHADAMDNIPEPIVLPREQSDEKSARVLSAVLPAVMEACDFETTYADCWDEKLKHGVGCYGVFWNAAKDNGLGDIDIRPLDILKVFWEPGITDIQKSRNLFVTELIDTDILEQMYPQHKGKLGGQVVDIKQYVYDDAVETRNKSLVVDWYYKKTDDSGCELLHLIKFVGNTLLFASENEAGYEGGWYQHGQYPVVFDNLYREKGSPVGFGLVSVCKDPQLYIDSLSGNILETSMMGSKRRYFASDSLNINIEQFKDWNEPVVNVAGEINDNRLKEIKIDSLDSIYVTVMEQKIEEMKDTASNRDVNNGSAGSGVTAAAAISALQEAGNKTSRDIINASYRSFKQICMLCIELMRQFYDESRCFRIIGERGAARFLEFSNTQIKEQQVGVDASGQPMIRKPVFDLKIKAQKKSAFTRLEQNELAKELYGLGFFNPERAQEVLPCLEMMDFEGIDKVRDKVQEGETLFKICQELSQQVQQLTSMVQVAVGQNRAMMPAGAGDQTGGDSSGDQTQTVESTGEGKNEDVMGGNSKTTPFMQRTAAAAGPNMQGA